MSMLLRRGALARSVALLFLKSGVLGPKHAFLATDPGARLGFVLATAYRHLRDSAASLDKWAMFALVIGYLLAVFAVLAAGALMLIASTAHADTPSSLGPSSSVFQAPNPDQDLAQNWLNYLFFAKDISQYVSQSGQIIPQATNIQKALQTALAVYSNAILVIAAIVLFYHLTSMVVETAHHGQVMGKRASQIWAPIRLVVAIGLLVPINGGLNSGQYIVVKMAEMGSGLASNVWQTFLTALAAEGPMYHAPKAPYVRNVIQDLVAMEACRLTFNYYVASTLGALGADTSAALIEPVVQPALVDIGTGVALPMGTSTLYTNRSLSGLGVCGGYDMGAVAATSGDQNNFESQIPAAIAKAHLATIQSLLSSGQITAVAKNVKYFIPGFNVTSSMPSTSNGFTSGDNFAPGSGVPSNAAVEALVTSYQQQLQTALTSAVNTMYGNALQNLATEWSSQGWVSAGAWFNTVARGQGAIIDAAQDGLPKTVPPQVALMGAPQDLGFLTRSALWLSGRWDSTKRGYDIAKHTADALTDFYVWANGTGAVSMSSGSAPNTDALKAAQEKVKTAAAGETNSGWNLMNAILSLVDKIAIARGAWSPGDLTFQFSNTGNPLAEVSYLGHAYLSTGLDLLAGAGLGSMVAGGLSFIPGLGGALASGIGFATGIAVFIALIIITGGFTLAFLVPLLPFIWFFFNVLTWMLSVLEAVVFMPLFALAHLNPEGEGLPGASARNAYFLILNIFLRPVLMIFGLVCGLLMFFVAISFLNMMYTIATAGTGASAGGFATIAKLVFSVIYAGLAYICANHSFKAIGYFPEHALRWIGSAGHHESMGTPEHMGAVMSGVAAFGGKEIGGAMQKPGAALQSAGTKRVEGAETAAKNRARDDRLIIGMGGTPPP